MIGSYRIHQALIGLLLAVFCSLVSAQVGSQWKKDADILAVGSNPLEEVSTLMQPTFVMARGNEVNLAAPSVDLFPYPDL